MSLLNERVVGNALLIESQKRIEELERQNAELQSQIDELMLEYCPEEMTKEQLDEWGKHQVCTESAEVE